jgi:hypothetical protein
MDIIVYDDDTSPSEIYTKYSLPNCIFHYVTIVNLDDESVEIYVKLKESKKELKDKFNKAVQSGGRTS